jgi:hypothetical protein
LIKCNKLVNLEKTFPVIPTLLFVSKFFGAPLHCMRAYQKNRGAQPSTQLPSPPVPLLPPVSSSPLLSFLSLPLPPSFSTAAAAVVAGEGRPRQQCCRCLCCRRHRCRHHCNCHHCHCRQHFGRAAAAAGSGRGKAKMTVWSFAVRHIPDTVAVIRCTIVGFGVFVNP